MEIWINAAFMHQSRGKERWGGVLLDFLFNLRYVSFRRSQHYVGIIIAVLQNEIMYFFIYLASACILTPQFSWVQSLSRVWLFATSWTAARQASLSITSSQSLTPHGFTVPGVWFLDMGRGWSEWCKENICSRQMLSCLLGSPCLCLPWPCGFSWVVCLWGVSQPPSLGKEIFSFCQGPCCPADWEDMPSHPLACTLPVWSDSWTFQGNDIRGPYIWR